MHRVLCVAFLATFCFASNAYAIDKTPAAMKRVIDKAVAEVKKNRQDFEKANEAPLEEAKEELQDLAKKFIEEGKTEEAQAVLRQVKSLDADVLRMAKAPDPVPAPEPRPGPHRPLLERLVGKWSNGSVTGDFIYVIDDKGVFHEILRGNGQQKGFGQLNEIAPGVAKVRVDHGWEFILTPGEHSVLTLVVCNPVGKPESYEVLRREKP